MLRFITNVLLMFFAFTGCASKIIHHSSNEFGPMWVEENRGMRCLSFVPVDKDGVRQTCRILKDPNRLIFQYQKVALSSLYLNPYPEDILVLGLGGGTLVTAMVDILPKSRFDVVEINSGVVDIAKKYFGFNPQSVNLSIDDGYKFVERAKESGKKYDLIILDAFSPDYIPEQFLTEKFVEMVKNILNAQGVVVVNTFAGRPEASLETSIYKNVFGEFLNIDVGGNRLIIAINGTFPSFENIGQNALAVKDSLEKHGVMRKWLLAAYSRGYKIAK